MPSRRTILVLAGLVFALWAVLYAGFWLARTGCFNSFTSTCNNAPIDWVGDIVMLRWVKSYQTILAGALAIAAGAFVLLAEKSRQAAEVRAKELERIEKTRHNIWQFRELVAGTRVAFEMTADQDGARGRVTALLTQGQPAVRQFFPQLAEMLIIAHPFIQEGLNRRFQHPNLPLRNWEPWGARVVQDAFATVVVLHNYMMLMDRVRPDGSIIRPAVTMLDRNAIIAAEGMGDYSDRRLPGIDMLFTPAAWMPAN